MQWDDIRVLLVGSRQGNIRGVSLPMLIFILLYPSFCLAEIFSDNALLPSLIRRLNIHHISFLKLDEDADNHFVELQKSLSKSMPWLYVSVVSHPKITSMVNAEFSRSLGSLVVIYENETDIVGLELVDATLSVDISPLKWILITDNFNVDKYKNLKIPYNCLFMVALGLDDTGYELIELYDTINVKKLSNNLGKWLPGDGLKMTDVGLFKRRENLAGTIFNISSNQENPCSVQSFESSAGSVLMCIHYHLFHLLGQRHNFSINWLPQNAGALGSTYLNKYLSDDIQFTIFEVNSNPKEGTTVIWPTTATPIAVYTSYTGRAFGWSTYIYPFSIQMWLAVLLWVIASAAIIGVIEFLLLQPEDRHEKRLCVIMWLQYIFLSFSAFCYQNEGVEPKRMSLRILFYLIFLIPTVLMPGYSAALTSYLTVQVERAPFRTLEELSKAKDYKLGYVASFNLSVFLDRNSEDEVVRRLYRDIILPPNKMPIRERDGLQRMCKEKFSYLCTVYTVIAVPPQCSYYSLDRPLVIALSMMPVKSNNSFRGLIQRRDLIYCGIFLVEALRVLPGTVTNPVSDDDGSQLEAVQFENIVAIIVLLGLGAFLSLILFLLEVVSFKRNLSDLNRITLPH